MAYANANQLNHPLDGLPTLPNGGSRPSVWERIRWGVALSKQRRSLRNLSSHILRDIGVTSTEAHIEADRMAWDVPKNWRC